MNECEFCEEEYEVESSSADDKERFCSQVCEVKEHNVEESGDSGDLDFENEDD